MNMKLMNNHRRLIAVAVTLAFVSLLHITSMPLGAHPAAAAMARADESDTPRVIEEESDGGSKTKKKSALPIILGVVGVGAIVAIVLMAGGKDKKDIRGTWTLTATITTPGYTGWTSTYAFSGSETSGTFIDGDGYTGTYTVSGDNVSFKYSGLVDQFPGTFPARTG
jgi:hypothetical protein